VKEAKLQTYGGQLEQLKMKEDDNIAAYFLLVDEIVNAIIGLGEEIKEFVNVQKVLISLLGSYFNYFIAMNESFLHRYYISYILIKVGCH
jgi:hypothetical protein